ncbi:hypothetical protein YPPY58_1500 [Yersinia pestis PY-58]|nr:hypothetical protein YPPY58_1500 [Yersinia pestis PY-58]
MDRLSAIFANSLAREGLKLLMGSFSTFAKAAALVILSGFTPLRNWLTALWPTPNSCATDSWDIPSAFFFALNSSFSRLASSNCSGVNGFFFMSQFYYR